MPSKAKGKPKGKAKREPKQHARTPARLKVTPWLDQAIAEKWTIAKLSEKSGVSHATAGKYLKEAFEKFEEKRGELTGNLAEQAVTEARNVRHSQIKQARRVQALGEKALQALEEKAESGEMSIRDYETLVKSLGKGWENIKEVSGLRFHEQMQFVTAKGEAQGRGIAQALDATAADLSQAITIDAEIVPD